MHAFAQPAAGKTSKDITDYFRTWAVQTPQMHGQSLASCTCHAWARMNETRSDVHSRKLDHLIAHTALNLCCRISDTEPSYYADGENAYDMRKQLKPKSPLADSSPSSSKTSKDGKAPRDSQKQRNQQQPQKEGNADAQEASPAKAAAAPEEASEAKDGAKDEPIIPISAGKATPEKEGSSSAGTGSEAKDELPAKAKPEKESSGKARSSGGTCKKGKGSKGKG